MSTLLQWIARIRGMFGDHAASRLEEEIKDHIESLTEDYVRQGMPEKEARYAAMRELGNLTSIAQQHREQNGVPLLENLWRDLKFAVRTLRRSPSYTFACTASLAVGLGAMVTVLSVVSALLWKPLPYPDSKSLAIIKEVDPRDGSWTFSEPDLVDLRQRTQSLAAVGAFRPGTSALTGAGDPETIQSAAVTPSCFRMFDIQPVIGRAFQGSPQEAVISRALWKRKWGMNPAAVGQAITLDGESYTVAGVADLPRDLVPGAEVLTPLLPKATESRSAHEIEAVGRLRAGVDLEQAQAELNTIARSIARENPQTNAGWGMRLKPLSDYVIGPRTARLTWMIFAAVALLWVLACANVAGLQMARNIARQHDLATRLALGASTIRLFGQMLVESVVLALFGSILGVLIAQFAVDVIRSVGVQSLPRLASVQINAGIIGIALACLFVSTLLCTLFARRPSSLLGGREISRRDRGRDAMIVAQVALASVLLLAASLLMHSFLRLKAVDPGFDPDRILSVRANLSAPGYDSQRKVTFFRDASQRLATLPEVESAGATNIAPFSGQGTANRFRLEGEPASADYRAAAWRAVTPGFFSTLALPLKRGRFFTDRDVEGSLEVVILSESMARKFWPNQDPIGKRLLWGRSGHPKTIVGIVGDLRDLAADTPAVPTMFRPFAQLADAPMTFVIRMKRSSNTTAIADIRREIWAVDRNAALEFRPVRDAMSDSMLRPRVGLMAFAAFALIAMITAVFGLYGLISYRVNQRQQEIGVRLALGCRTAWMRWSIQKRCLMLVCAGLVIGLPAAYMLSTLMTSLLYETQPNQPSAYAAVLAVFAGVALAASFGPAYRASRMDPSTAIRHE